MRSIFGRRFVPLRGAARLLVLAAGMLAQFSPLPSDAQYGADQQIVIGGGLYHGTAHSNAWSIVADGKNDLHVIYNEGDPFDPDDDWAPWLLSFNDFTGWGAPVRIPVHAPAKCYGDVAIAGNRRDQVHTLWVETDFDAGTKSLYSRSVDSLGVWGAEELLAGVEAPLDLGSPCIASDHWGNVFAYWHEGEQESPEGPIVNNIHYRIYDAKLGFWRPEGKQSFLDPDDTAYPGAIHPTLAVEDRVFDPTLGPNGEWVSVIHMAWSNETDGLIEYRAFKYNPTRGKIEIGGSSIPVGDTVSPPSIAVRCRRVHLVWGVADIMHLTGVCPGNAPALAAFPAPVSSGYSGVYPNVCIDGLGNAHIVYETLPGGGLEQAMWDADSGSYLATWLVSDGLSPGRVNATIAADEEGDIQVVWMDYLDDLTKPGVFSIREAASIRLRHPSLQPHPRSTPSYAKS